MREDARDAVEMDTKGLDQILKALKRDPPVGKLGVLGGKDVRSGKEDSNASIGIKHEFGKDGMPIRSFLRVPLIENMQKYLNKSGLSDKDKSEALFKEVVRQGSFSLLMKKIMVIGETVVLDAFATGGFGKWKPSDMRFKKNHQTLVETQQLRNSITSEVKND